jgi:3-hydroxy-D-aspartate aldolase
MPSPPLNESLIGRPGSRALLQTPALVVDLDALERNIKRMADHTRARSIGLRPHAKTHKSAEIARRQIAAGALGVCVAKLGEAEVLRVGGIQSLLVTSPIVSDAGIRRLIALNETSRSIMAVCDNASVARRISDAAKASGKLLDVLVDLDPGTGRTGAPLGNAGIELIERVAAHAGLNYSGVQCYAGNLQHIEAAGERRERSLSVMRKLGEFTHRLGSRGLAPKIVSGGGTGTFDIDPDAAVLTELQAGSYVFMDREYNDVWSKNPQRIPFEPALFVQTTVISVGHGASVTTDAGTKSFATDAGAPTIVSAVPSGAIYGLFGDEFGKVSCPPDGPGLLLGDVVTCLAPHCDPTVNLYDWYHVVRGDVLEAIWPIDARGRSA